MLDGEPTDYQRYANEWCYTYSTAAGQVVRVLNVAEHPAAAVLMRAGDFWVVESQHVARVRYGPSGAHQGEVEVEDNAATGYIAAAEMGVGVGDSVRAVVRRAPAVPAPPPAA